MLRSQKLIKHSRAASHVPKSLHARRVAGPPDDLGALAGTVPGRLLNKLTAWPRRRRPVGGVFRANAGAFTLLLFASAVPTPLYGEYAAKFGFSADLLTVIFAVYAVPLLAALLVFGDLSDAIGRKPVTLAALPCSSGCLPSRNPPSAVPPRPARCSSRRCSRFCVKPMQCRACR